MNIQQLKYFMEVAQMKSFSKAAENLYISQQGISMAIARLEAEFSTKLFTRTPKGLILPPAGEYLLGRAEIICGEYSKCLDYFSDHRPQDTVINVAGVQGVVSEFAADYIVDFQDNYPNYKLFLREFTDRACDQVVEDGKAEVGLGLEPLDEKKFDCYPLFSKRLVLLVHRSHPLAERTVIPTALLQDLPMALVDEKQKSADHFLDLCKQVGVEPKVLYRVGEVGAVHRLVGRNKCAGLSVETVAEALRTPDTVAIPFEDSTFRWTVDLFKRKGAELSAAGTAFWNFFRDHLEQTV